MRRKGIKVKRKGISPVVSAVFVIAIAIIVAVGLWFWVPGLVGTKVTPGKTPIKISVTPINGSAGTFTITNTDTRPLILSSLDTDTSGVTCSFGGTVTIEPGQSRTCTLSVPKSGEILFIGANASGTVVVGGVQSFTLSGSGSSGVFSQSSEADFSGGTFNNTNNGSIVLNYSLPSEFRVNYITAGTQQFPRIDMSAGGDFVMVWEDATNDEVYAKPYYANLSNRTAEFRVNTNTTNAQEQPDVAMDASGGYIVVWESLQSGDDDIYAKVYWANDSVRISDFIVNGDTTSTQILPAVDMDPGGNFVVTWKDARSGNYEIYGKSYWANGSVRTSDFQVNTNTTGEQEYPDVGVSTTGNYVIAWEDPRNAVDDDVYAVAYFANGTIRTAEFQVNTAVTAGYQTSVEVKLDSDDNYVLSWGNRNTSIRFDVYAKSYWANGTVRVADFIPQNVTTSDVNQNGVAVNNNTGDWIVSYGITQGVNDGYIKAFYANGTNKTGDVRHNDKPTTSEEPSPAIAMDSSGNYVAAWTVRPSGLDRDIFAKVYYANNTARNFTNYTASGTFTSSIFDTGASPATFANFNISTTSPDLTNITYYLLFSNSSGFTNSISERAGSSDTLIEATGRYVRYQANLSSHSPYISTSLNNIALTYKAPINLTYTVNYDAGISTVNVSQSCPVSVLSFDGVEDFVDLGSNLTFPRGEVSVEAWVKQDPTSGFGTAGSTRTISIGDSNEAVDFKTGTDNNFIFVIQHVNGSYTFDTVAFNNNTWNHPVGTFDNSSFRMYVNGTKLVDTTPNAAGVKAPTVNSRISGYGTRFHGLLDNVRIYNRVLNTTEVSQHSQGLFTNDSGLVAKWSFSEGTGTTVYDESGIGNTATLGNETTSTRPAWTVTQAYRGSAIVDGPTVVNNDFYTTTKTGLPANCNYTVWANASNGAVIGSSTYVP